MRSAEFPVSAQKLAGYGVAAIAAILVLYPVFYLLQASLDVGEPNVRPPTAYGLDNFAGCFNYWEIMLNTLIVSFAATVMALVFGFLTAWILTRTNVPFRRTLEQLMAVPYYVTPLLGALAWSLLGAPESGFINQIWRAIGGTGALIDINTPYRHRLGDGAVRGLGRLRHDRGVMKSMDPALEEASQVMGASRLAHHAEGHAAAGRAGRARRRDLRLRRDAGLVRGRARARHAGPLSTSSRRRSTSWSRNIRRESRPPRPWACRCSPSCS